MGEAANFSLVSSFCFSSGVSVSMGEAAKHRSFCCAHVAVSLGEAAKHRSFCCAHVAVSMGKLQNLSLVSSFCFSSGISVSMGEAAKHRSFCCAHVAVPMGQAAKPQSLLVFWRLRAYGGSCKTSLVLLRSRCRVYGEAAKHQSLLVFWRLASPRLWGKLQNIVRFAALSEGMWKPISCLFWTRPSLWVMMINGIVDILWSTSIHLLPIESVGASLHLLLQLLPIVACTQSTARSQLANLRRTNHYLILDRYGQIDSCSHDIVDVRPTGCLVNACDLLFYLFHPFSDPSCQRTSPALSAQSRKATLLASIFQHLSTACLLFLAFFYEKGRIRFKMKKINLARGWEDTPPGLDRAAKFADMACELSWDPIGCATGCLQLQWERL